MRRFFAEIGLFGFCLVMLLLVVALLIKVCVDLDSIKAVLG